MPPPEFKLESAGVAATFRWSEDRYEHAITCGESRLQASDSDAFDTPVFTEIHRQGDVLFASGMSGGRHWSASIEPIQEGFVFDVACRVKSAERPAGSCYRGHGLRLMATANDPHAPSITTLVEADRFVALPEDPGETPPYTLRYRYRVAAK